MKRLLFALATGTALWVAACSSGGSSTPPPPPAGNFGPANLNGTYAFMTSGEVFTNGNVSAFPMQRVGSFVANGSGGITGGVEDVNTSGTPSGASAITGGSYTVNADGRGTLTLQFGQNTLNFGIVLTSSSTGNGLMIDETNTSNQASTGSGNFLKQDTTLCSSPNTSVVGTYVFDFSGLDSSQAPESFVGEFTSNNAGAVTTSFGDINDGFNGLSNGTFAAQFGVDGLNPAGPNSCGRGQAQIAGETYAYYVVDSNRVRFINAAGGEMLSGDAVLQDNTIPTNVASINSGFAFLVGGSTGQVGLTRVGRLSISNSTVSNVLLDTNNGGTQFTPTNGATNPSITLDSANPGRGTITFVGNGQNPNVPFSFVFYLSSANQGVIQEITTNINTGAIVAVADGSIDAQSGSPFTSSNVSGTYAMNWSGLVTLGGSFTDEEDLVAQAKISNLSLSGTSDIFQFTSLTLTPQPNIATSGSITFNGGDGTGGDGKRSTLTVKLSGANQINFVTYFVTPNLAFFANQDNNSGRVVAGVLETQQ
ncbi:MAG TPA: hypothetical protein VMH48_06715 [Methylomirabilota bacterium]|nr:hypothetical protein [Methylomirabilota bacterium]